MRARTIGFSALSAATLALPMLASAQVTVGSTLALFANLFNAAIWLLVTVAVVVFFFGLVKYIMSKGGGHGGEHGGGEGLMLWGIIAIFVMVSIWGIIRLLQTTFQVGGGGAIVPSTIPVQNVGFSSWFGL